MPPNRFPDGAYSALTCLTRLAQRREEGRLAMGSELPQAILAMAVANRCNVLSALERQLAGCLYNLGNELAALGRTAEAVPWHRETVEIFRPLYQQHPDGFRGWMQQMLFDYLESACEAGEEVVPEMLDLRQDLFGGVRGTVG